MKSKNIYLQYHYKPIYKFKIFKDNISEEIQRNLIILLVFQFISTYHIKSSYT